MRPHPACIDGEDEVGCFEQYIERGFVSKSANYICQSPYHNATEPIIEILATACDGNPECFKETDEQGCSFKWTVYFMSMLSIVRSTYF